MPGWDLGAGRASEWSIGQWRPLSCIFDHLYQDIFVVEGAIGGAFDLEHYIVQRYNGQAPNKMHKNYQLFSYLCRHSLRMSMKSFFTPSMSLPMDCVSFMKSLKMLCHFQFSQRFFLHLASYFYWRWSSSFLYFLAFSSVRRQLTSKVLILLLIWLSMRFSYYYLTIQFCYFSFRILTQLARSYRFSFYTLLGTCCLVFFLEVIASVCYNFILNIYCLSASLSSLNLVTSLSYLFPWSSIYLSNLLYFYNEILAISCASLTMSSYFLDPFRLSPAELDFDLPLSSFMMLMTYSYSLIFSSWPWMTSFISSILRIFLRNLLASDWFSSLTNMQDSLRRSFISSLLRLVLEALLRQLFLRSFQVLMVLNQLPPGLAYLWSFSRSLMRDRLGYSLLLAELISTAYFKYSLQPPQQEQQPRGHQEYNYHNILIAIEQASNILFMCGVLNFSINIL